MTTSTTTNISTTPFPDMKGFQFILEDGKSITSSTFQLDFSILALHQRSHPGAPFLTPSVPAYAGANTHQRVYDSHW
jgi:hypothetical protein